MWRNFNRLFLAGLAVLVPILVTLFLLSWAIGGIESATRSVLLLVVPEDWYLPGTGLVVTVGLVLALGVASRIWFTGALLRSLEGLVAKIPVVSSIYSPMREIMRLLQGDLTDKLGQPVMLDSLLRGGAAPSRLRRFTPTASVGARGLRPRFARPFGPFSRKTAPRSAGRPAKTCRAPRDSGICRHNFEARVMLDKYLRETYLAEAPRTQRKGKGAILETLRSLRLCESVTISVGSV